MPINTKRHVVRVVRKHRHPRPFNFASGLIYILAAIVSISLGAIFYRGYKRDQPPASSESSDAAADLAIPPGARVVTKNGKQTIAPTPEPTAPAKPAPVEDPFVREAPLPPEPETPQETAAVAEPAPAVMPDLVPPPRVPWIVSAADETASQKARVYCTADTCITLNPAGKRDLNRGGDTNLTLRGNDSVVLAKYDFSKIAGWTISKATWHARMAKGDIRELGFSSVMADWAEGAGPATNAAPGGASFKQADTDKPWRADGAPAPYVFRGNANSLFSSAIPDKKGKVEDEWISVPMDPALVQSMMVGGSFGMAITDEKGQLGESIEISSREDNQDGHFIEIEGAMADMSQPGRVTDLRAWAHPALRRADSVGVLLSWTASGDDAEVGQAFLYDIRYAPAGTPYHNATALPRDRVPSPQPSGKPDKAIITGLEPDSLYSFFVRPMDEAGQPGPVEEVQLRAPQLLALPEIPAPPAPYDAAPIEVAPGMGLRVLDENAAANPVDGALAESTAAERSEGKTSYAWERNSRTLHLRGAANEDIAFTLLFTRKTAKVPAVKIGSEPFQGLKGKLGADALKFHRVVYGPVQQGQKRAWIGDALAPLDGALAAGAWTNVPGQQAQAVYAEMKVPEGAATGTYRSQLTFTDEAGAQSKVMVLLDVLPFSMPAKPSFEIELLVPLTLATLYKKDVAKTDEALPIETEYAALAAANRCELDMIPYLRNGTCPEAFRPTATGTGLDFRATNWDAWDQRFGGRISGGAHFLVPLFENWPTPYVTSYLCRKDEEPSRLGPYPVHVGPSDSLYGCFTSDFWRAFRAAARQFREHFVEKGATAVPQIFFNDVPGSPIPNGQRPPPWSLGAPRFRSDFLALESFAQVAKPDPAGPAVQGRLDFRVAVPDLSVLGAYGEGKFSLLAVSDTDPAGWGVVADRARRTGERVWFQSDTAPLDRSPLPVEATVLRYLLAGADGWSVRDSIGKVPPQNLIPSGLAVGAPGPLPSLRLKAMRRAEQDVEYLLALKAKNEWTSEQLADFVRKRFPTVAAANPLTCNDLALFRIGMQDLLVVPEVKGQKPGVSGQ